MKKIAVIDIGTNSMRMLIAQVDQDKIIQSQKTIQSTRIGQEMIKGEITPSAFARNFNALKRFKENAEKEKVEKILVFGTSALRDASNTNDFFQRVKTELGLSIKILSGQEEAEIGFMGVVHDIDQDVLIIDIGGGSTELISGSKEKGIVDVISINIGALRATQNHIKGHVIKEQELDNIERELHSLLKEVSIKLFSSSTNTSVIGIGGTIITLSAIKQKMEIYDGKKIHLSKLSKQDIDDIYIKLSSVNLEERKKIIGLEPGRADIIVAGLIILMGIMEMWDIEKLTISDHDNLEGMLYYDLEEKEDKRH